MLDLATLIELDQQLGWDKDEAVLPVLRRTLEESRKDKGVSFVGSVAENLRVRVLDLATLIELDQQ